MRIRIEGDQRISKTAPCKKKEYGISLTGCPSFDGLRTGSIGLYSQRNDLSMYSCSGSSKQRGTNGTCWSIPLINCFSNHETVVSQPPLNQQENIKTWFVQNTHQAEPQLTTPPTFPPNQPQRTTPKRLHQGVSKKSLARGLGLQAAWKGSGNGFKGFSLGISAGLWGNNTSSSSGNAFFFGVFQGSAWEFTLGLEKPGFETPHPCFESKTRNHRGLLVTTCNDENPSFPQFDDQPSSKANGSTGIQSGCPKSCKLRAPVCKHAHRTPYNPC